ncbi:hypothetical protein ACFL1G_03880 [Planctomycetota bacterium]
MTDEEKKIEDFIREIEFDDKPDSAHRDKLEKDLLAAMQNRTTQQTNYWRIIMKSKITKLAAAAIVLVAISFFSVFIRQNDSTSQTNSISCFTLLSQACAAEQSLFTSKGIVHIVNEITVYPAPDEKSTSTKLEQLNLPVDLKKTLETANSWLDYNWLPLCSLGADGQFCYSQLELSQQFDKAYTITDQAWYDPATGCFARVMKIDKDEKVIFANSYDGQFVYYSQPAADGSLRLLSERTTPDFNPPQNPAEFLGITAGIRDSISDEIFPPIERIADATIEPGVAVRVYKQGFVDMFGDINTYWLFKARDDNKTIAEMEFVLANSTQLVIRRVLCESVKVPQFSWDLVEIDQQIRHAQQSPKVAVQPDIMRSNISVQHMIDNASFETYILGKTPSWTDEPQLDDMADFANPQERMFIITYRANDGRHLILCQSKTFNDFLRSILAYGAKTYTSSNGVKLWDGGSTQKWWTEIHLSSAGFTPADDRSGYVLESPTDTFVSVAVNGQLTEEELQELTDSLIPAKEYQKLIIGDSNE